MTSKGIASGSREGLQHSPWWCCHHRVIIRFGIFCKYEEPGTLTNFQAINNEDRAYYFIALSQAAVEAKQIAQQESQRAALMVQKAIQEKEQKIVEAVAEATNAKLVGDVLCKKIPKICTFTHMVKVLPRFVMKIRSLELSFFCAWNKFRPFGTIPVFSTCERLTRRGKLREQLQTLRTVCSWMRTACCWMLIRRQSMNLDFLDRRKKKRRRHQMVRGSRLMHDQLLMKFCTFRTVPIVTFHKWPEPTNSWVVRRGILWQSIFWAVRIEAAGCRSGTGTRQANRAVYLNLPSWINFAVYPLLLFLKSENFREKFVIGMMTQWWLGCCLNFISNVQQQSVASRVWNLKLDNW